MSNESGRHGTSTNGEVPRDIALYLLAHAPGYRELIKQRVSEAQKRAKVMDDRWLDPRERPDVDLLTERWGKEVEGCG